MYHKSHDDFEEALRLEALHALTILDTPAERAFDALAALVARLLDCPAAALTLIDADRQWIKARVGFDRSETTRREAFCDHTIRADQPMVVADASTDPRFADNQLVTGPDQIRFYAGVPLHAPGRDGLNRRVGALCAIDCVPRTISDAQRDMLVELGALADALLAARKTSRDALAIADRARQQTEALRRSDLIFRQAERMGSIGAWRFEVEGDVLEWSEGVSRIHELPPGELPSMERALDFYPPRQREHVRERLMQAIAHGTPFSFETDFITAKGNLRRVRSMGEPELADGQTKVITGVFQDITTRYELEQSLRRLATTDDLTGISNRAAFNGALETAIDQASAGGPALLLVLIDLDHFKQINDRLGHNAGDDVLRATGARLRMLAREGLAARLGGDEFALILRGDDADDGADMLVTNVLGALAAPIEIAGETITPSATIGYARFDPARHRAVRDLVHAADSALYEAKRAGRGQARPAQPHGRRAGDRT